MNFNGLADNGRRTYRIFFLARGTPNVQEVNTKLSIIAGFTADCVLQSIDMEGDSETVDRQDDTLIPPVQVYLHAER
jgi:hypothetical protein